MSSSSFSNKHLSFTRHTGPWSPRDLTVTTDLPEYFIEKRELRKRFTPVNNVHEVATSSGKPVLWMPMSNRPIKWWQIPDMVHKVQLLFKSNVWWMAGNGDVSDTDRWCQTEQCEHSLSHLMSLGNNSFCLWPFGSVGLAVVKDAPWTVPQTTQLWLSSLMILSGILSWI